MRAIFLVLLTIITVPVVADEISISEPGPEQACPAALEKARQTILEKHQNLSEEQKLIILEEGYMLRGFWMPDTQRCHVFDLLPMSQGSLGHLTPEEILEKTLLLMVANGEISDYEYSDDKTYVVLIE